MAIPESSRSLHISSPCRCPTTAGERLKMRTGAVNRCVSGPVHPLPGIATLPDDRDDIPFEDSMELNLYKQLWG